MDELTPLMDAPIPGQSLTAEIGSRPWQQPAKFTTAEEALEHYATRITNPRINDSLFDALEMGTPVASIAEIVVQNGAMEGMHTVDVSILILPIIMELIAYVADESNIEYSMGLDDPIDQDKIPESKIALAIKKARDKKPDIKETEPVMEPKEPSQSSGLMARRA
tara:strand:+ start:432 stop:926 length:495 start_codon:yes stop_codon:yes gene_type:complete